MDTKYIQNFFKVVDCGSMSEAARQLDVSPAAIAQQMRTLEQALGTRLLVRSGRNVRPTASGERLFERGRQWVQDYDELRDWVCAEPDAGELKLGSINTLLHGLLPDVMETFLAQLPAVRISLRAGLTPELCTALMQSELDAVFCLKPHFELPKNFQWQALRHEALVLVVPEHLQGQDPLELLRTQPLVRYDRKLGGGKMADRYLRAQGISPLERIELNSVLAATMMVQKGLGVALVPHIGDVLAHYTKVRLLPVPDVADADASLRPAYREVGLLWPTSSSRSRWLACLLQCARQHHA